MKLKAYTNQGITSFVTRVEGEAKYFLFIVFPNKYGNEIRPVKRMIKV